MSAYSHTRRMSNRRVLHVARQGKALLIPLADFLNSPEMEHALRDFYFFRRVNEDRMSRL